jgi:hypothetical protein
VIRTSMKKYKQILCDLTLDSGPTQKVITVWRGVVEDYLLGSAFPSLSADPNLSG